VAAYLHFFEDENTTLGMETKTSIQQQFGAVDIALNNLGTVKSGDALFLIGHGTPTDLSGYTPPTLAKLLTDNGLSQPVQIFLYSCDTGFGGAPYALELKIQLVQLKVLCTVLAPTGPIDSAFGVDTTSNKSFYGTGRLPQVQKPSWVK